MGFWGILQVRFVGILVLALAMPNLAWATSTGGRYNADYAQDLAKCPKHFAKGVPPTLLFDKSGKEQHPLCFKAFGLVYSGISKTAIYSAHHLTKADIDNARQLKREDSFRPESRLPRRLQVQLSDYKNQGYDRGHLVPNGDMPNKEEQYDSFSLANIVPQNREHNQGLWRTIESHTRNLAYRYGETYVVTGTAFMGKNLSKMNGVIVPSHLYKAVYIPKNNTVAVYFSPNTQTASYEIIDVAEFRKRTGVVPFPAIKNAKFDPTPFALDSRNDQSGKKPKDPKPNKENQDSDSEQNGTQDDNVFLRLIVQIIIAIWKAIAS